MAKKIVAPEAGANQDGTEQVVAEVIPPAAEEVKPLDEGGAGDQQDGTEQVAEGDGSDAVPAPQLVKMYRDIESDDDGPEEADVHPDEVGNYEIGGWMVASE